MRTHTVRVREWGYCKGLRNGERLQAANTDIAGLIFLGRLATADIVGTSILYLMLPIKVAY